MTTVSGVATPTSPLHRFAADETKRLCSAACLDRYSASALSHVPVLELALLHVRACLVKGELTLCSWIGDQFCDKGCNVSACGFDAGDCSLESIFSLPNISVTPTVRLVLQRIFRNVPFNRFESTDDPRRDRFCGFPEASLQRTFSFCLCR